MEHRTGTREEWLAARKALLVKEKALTRARDALMAERRALPWVRIDKPYVFHGSDGDVSLTELFAGRSQLMVYHFMYGPDWTAGCPGCSFLCDHVDAARRHFEHNDLSFVAVSRTSVANIEAYRRRMGWTFRWVSALASDFNFDFGVSFTPEQLAAGPVEHNFTPQHLSMQELHGESLFYRDGDGSIYHTYSSYARAGEDLIGAYRFLDFAPLGRNEGEGGNMMVWMRRHDEYAD